MQRRPKFHEQQDSFQPLILADHIAPFLFGAISLLKEKREFHTPSQAYPLGGKIKEWLGSKRRDMHHVITIGSPFAERKREGVSGPFLPWRSSFPGQMSTHDPLISLLVWSWVLFHQLADCKSKPLFLHISSLSSSLLYITSSLCDW